MSTPITNLVPTTELTAAYQAAAQRHAKRLQEGANVVGHKVGYTNMKAWNDLGITAPMWGPMYDDTVIDAGSGTFRWDLGALHGPRIEPEIVLGLERAPQPGMDMQALLACVEWIAQGFELVVSPRDGKPGSVAGTIANGGNHGVLLIGERRPVSVLGDDAIATLGALHVELRCDGELKDTGSSANVLEHPLNAVSRLMEGLAREGRDPLRAGDIVSTGTMTAAFPAAPGQRWTTRLSGAALPDLDVVFD
jgi:2-keto-4-pentenoate hydratase